MNKSTDIIRRTYDGSILVGRSRTIDCYRLDALTVAIRAQLAEVDALLRDIRSDAQCLHWHEDIDAVIGAADQPPTTPCRIVEYDGAYKCLTHHRQWGAVTNPDAPCAGAEERPKPDSALSSIEWPRVLRGHVVRFALTHPEEQMPEPGWTFYCAFPWAWAIWVASEVSADAAEAKP